MYRGWWLVTLQGVGFVGFVVRIAVADIVETAKRGWRFEREREGERETMRETVSVGERRENKASRCHSPRSLRLTFLWYTSRYTGLFQRNCLHSLPEYDKRWVSAPSVMANDPTEYNEMNQRIKKDHDDTWIGRITSFPGVKNWKNTRKKM